MSGNSSSADPSVKLINGWIIDDVTSRGKDNSVVINLVMGSLYTIFSTAFMTIDILCIHAIRITPGLYEKPCYKLMILMTVMEILNNWGLGFHSGIMSLANSLFNFFYAKVVGAILNGAWMSFTLLATFLAVNRTVTVASRYYSKLLYGGKKIWLWIGAALCYGLAFMISYLWPNNNILYFLDQYTWNYDNTPDSYNNSIAEMCLCIFVSYTVLAVLIKQQRSLTSSHKMHKSEKLALTQSFVMCLAMVVAYVCWFAIPLLLPGWLGFIANAVFVCFSGSGGITFLAFNATVRYKIAVLLGLTKCFKIEVVPDPPPSASNLRRRSSFGLALLNTNRALSVTATNVCNTHRPANSVTPLNVRVTTTIVVEGAAGEAHTSTAWLSG